MDNNMEGVIDESADSDIGHNFGDPEVLPRVGDQYQAEIPVLMTEYDRLELIKEMVNTEVLIDAPNATTGLPIPVMWVHDKFEITKNKSPEVHDIQDDAIDNNGLFESENSGESQITSKIEESEHKVEPLFTALDFKNLKEVDHRVNGYRPVPGSMSDAWRGIESDSFLLGIYIFGKNLRLVKKFVDSKEMGDILSHYYGKFYRSNEYRRWSDCRKLRGRRCIHGEKMFTGWRQQELLSRLFSHVSEEGKSTLMEVSRTFGEAKFSLEEYVYTLKNTVGINKLVEAIGIGKGKRDLTGTAVEPTRTSHILPVRPEIPSGKACSSLTLGEIIKLLNGDFRLSKARSNDLFWEAVWPRLLARGWHSEQPRDHGSAGSSKHSLVFLLPGVKKFSRRLMKGDHYFDSVTDILNKVASEPGLLELESDAAEVSPNKEEFPEQHMNLEADGSSNRQRHCYLLPRSSNINSDLLKFTVVDTSLLYGKDHTKVRELRSLPIEPKTVSTSSGLSGETDHCSTSLVHDKKESNMLTPVESACEKSADSPKRGNSDIVKNLMPNGRGPMVSGAENHEDQSTSISGKPSMPLKFQFSRKGSKKRQLTECSQAKPRHGSATTSLDTKNGEDAHFLSDSTNTCADVDFQVGTCPNLSSASSFAGSTRDSNKGNPIIIESSPENAHPQTLIDLNLPPDVPMDSATDGIMHSSGDFSESLNPSNTVANSEQQNVDFSESLNPSETGANAQQNVVNARRHSTRNRPLTIKALEAFACGFLNPPKKRKGVSANESTSRNSLNDAQNIPNSTSKAISGTP